MSQLSDIRTKKVKKNIIFMFLIKGGSILVSLLYVPLLLHSMNASNYGIWLTLTSIISWISVFDIGLGHGLRNKLTTALAQNNLVLAKTYVSTAYVCIFSLSILIVFIFFVFESFINWNDVLNAKDILPNELRLLVIIVFVSFVFNFSLHLLTSVLYALQMPSFSSAIQFFGQVLSFISVLVAVKCLGISSLVTLGGMVAIIPPIVMLMVTLILFSTKYKHIAPLIKYYDSQRIKDVISLGVKFFIAQISLIFIYQSNNLIITNTIGSRFVTEFNICYKYMFLIYMLFSILVVPFWSSTTDAYARGDYKWIKNSLYRINRLFIVCCVVLAVMVVLAPVAYNLWVGSEIVIPVSVNIAMAIASMTQTAYCIHGNFVNGIGKVKLITYVHLVSAIIYIPLALLLVRQWGLVGVCIATICVNVALGAVAKIQCNKLLNETAVGIWDK